MEETAGAQPDATTGHRSGGRAGWPVDPHRLARTMFQGRSLLIGVVSVGFVIGLLVVKLGMTSAYETTAVLKYEGELRVAGLRQTNDAMGPAADALMRQSVLREIRERIGFDGTLTRLAAAIDYEMNLMSGANRRIGYIVLGLPDEFRSLPDRAGNVADFWGA